MAEENGVTVAFPKGAGPEAQKRGTELSLLVSEAKTFISGVFGVAPGVPLRVISVKRGAGFSSVGTILVDDSVFRRSKIDSQTAISVVEGIVKMWLGGSSAIQDEGEGAVREGLSRYLATQFIESKFGKDVADAERTRQRNAYTAVVSRDAPITAVSPLDDYYYSVVANKGSQVWRLLSKKAGDTAFASAFKS